MECEIISPYFMEITSPSEPLGFNFSLGCSFGGIFSKRILPSPTRAEVTAKWSQICCSTSISYFAPLWVFASLCIQYCLYMMLSFLAHGNIKLPKKKKAFKSLYCLTNNNHKVHISLCWMSYIVFLHGLSIFKQ